MHGNGNIGPWYDRFPAQRALRRLVGALALGATAFTAHAAVTMAPSPAIPTYGQTVGVELQTSTPYFLPSVRYSRHGSLIVVAYDSFANAFGPFPPNMGFAPLSLGELPPGNYTLTAHVMDIDHPGTVLETTTSNLPVLPPTEFGAYSVPQAPHAYENVGITIRSAAYFSPSSMRASVIGNTIRVDFNYDGTYGLTTAPAGMAMYGTVSVGSLPPGSYNVEAWGTPTAGGGTAQKYFTSTMVVSTPATVVEYYQESLDHYFISASPDEVNALDTGAQGGWLRTGQTFHAWLKAQEAPPQARPVCRFYAAGPNSHFFTADDGECTQLKQLEQSQRAQAQAEGKPYLGWSYEGIAFYALAPQNGQCPAGTTPVWRSYNGRAQENDSNHRFTADSRARDAMLGWSLEGVAFCSPA